jgi:gamma-glutamyl hercynylcysteine S-oxide synthase
MYLEALMRCHLSLTHALLWAVLLTGCPDEATSEAPGVSQKGPITQRPAEGPEPDEPLEMADVGIPGGAFVMGSEGSTKGGRDDERPRAERTTRGFRLDVHEVTNRDYARFLDSDAAREHTFCYPSEPRGKKHKPGTPTPEEREWGAVPDPFGGPDREDHPVVCVDWYDAYAFAAWAGRRLPNEDEWERAARDTDGRRYPWGDADRVDEDGQFPYANSFLPDPYPMTAPVGSFPRGVSEAGIQDLAGNVWEWTSSSYLAYEGAPEGTAEDEQQMVLRGGGWTAASPLLLRGAMRMAKPPTYRSAALGFRTAANEE